jgi:3-oxoacyl-[acyl-carrier protein] reductase
MDFHLKGKRVLVLGSSAGLGFAVAKAFAEEGAHVAICSRDQKRIEAAALEIPGAKPFVCDLDKIGEGKKLVEAVIKALGGIDILFINTGGPSAGVFENLDLTAWQKGFEKLYLSAIECIQASLPSMKKQKWGRIILNTSTAAKEPIASLVISSGLRSGLLGLMKTLSGEVAPFQITVNAILPGYIQTERLTELGQSADAISRDIPMGRIGSTEEFAALSVFLGSKQAAYITGQAIACDGGRLRGI